jgi:acyl-CoA reductase-like NAD-dependent aldehyde dehydrogenase
MSTALSDATRSRGDPEGRGRGAARLEAGTVAERAKLISKAVDCLPDPQGRDGGGDHPADGPADQPEPGRDARLRGTRALYDPDRADALADVEAKDKAGFTRFIHREPLGVVFIVAPWNYPYLTSVNGVVPALMAGQCRGAEAFRTDPALRRTLPAGLRCRPACRRACFQHLVSPHEDTAKVIAAPETAYVNFTGSVAGGHAVQQAALGKFMGMGLELGGKDPAYVRADAKLDHAIENLVDGAMFNSGQCCCAIERIYVHESLYDKFVEGFRGSDAQVQARQSAGQGHQSRADGADLGGRVRARPDHRGGPRGRQGADRHQGVRRQQAGHALSGAAGPVNVDHNMSVMSEESFGPVIGIMKVKSDDEAIKLMNDSKYGLTAALWTMDEAAAKKIGHAIDTGTVYMNRCDYLDPALAWVGVKDSGRGATLSRVGYEMLTRPKSFHLRAI